MRVRETQKWGLAALSLSLTLAGAACQETPVANVNTSTANGNSQTTTVTAPAVPAESSVINTREPEEYRATLVFTQAQTAGANQQSIALPSIEVARNGADRRYAINVPALGQIVFLDRTDKRYVIMPSRRQYAELSSEMTGVDLRSMTPGQMVTQLQKQQGVQLVGDEELNGRVVTKYRYAASARTGSQAGDVSAESFIYVDKETGLPLRIEGFGQSTSNVQGVSGGRVVAELRDVQTDVDPTLFEVPQGFQQLTAEQLKQQVGAVAAFLQVLMGHMATQAAAGSSSSSGAPPATGSSPAFSPSPAAAATPSPAAP